MAFDPDAYLAKKGAQGGSFDPDAYLAKKAETATKPTKFVEPFPVEESRWTPKAIAGSLKDRLVQLARGAGAVATTVRHPIDTLGDSAKRRQLIRGVDDVMSGGYVTKGADWLTSKLPESLQHGTTGREPASMAETAAADTQAAPEYRTGGNLIGVALPSPVKAGAGKVLQATKKVIPGVGVLPGLARGVVTYEATAPLLAAGHADSAGRRLETAGEVATDPVGLLMAGGTGAAVEGVANKVRNSRGYQARQFIEKEGQGAKVGVTTPGKGGVFEKELAGVEPTDKGIGVAAKRGSKAILKGIKDEHRIETSAPYKARKAEIDNTPAAGRTRDATSIVQKMQEAAYDLETDPSVQAKLEGRLKLLERYRKDPDSPVMVPERQLNGLRRSLMRMAKIGQTDSPGEKEAPLRAAAFEAKALVDRGPYAALNEFYHEGMTKLGNQRQQLGLKAKAPADANVDVKKLKLTLEREGQNTKTGGGDSDIGAFREQNPQLRAPTNYAELARARADLSFRLAPRHGGLIERAAGGAIGPVGLAAATAAGHGVPGLLGAAGIMAMQNASPIAGRALAPLATRGAVNPIVWAYMEQQRRSEEMAKRLKAGGRQ